VLIGVSVGLLVTSLNSLTLWITSSLFGGYAAANVLKWIWWRFNGMGYFAGMLAGLVASLFVPPLARMLFPGIIDIYIFPVIFLITFLACVFTSMATQPEDMSTLKQFYKQTRPWGFWNPIKTEIIKDDSSFQGNKDFKRDAFNVVIGIIWQMSMIVIPLYLLTKNTEETIIAVVVFTATSIILKKTWYNNLKNVD
jgi:hypothetical protein